MPNIFTNYLNHELFLHMCTDMNIITFIGICSERTSVTQYFRNVPSWTIFIAYRQHFYRKRCYNPYERNYLPAGVINLMNCTLILIQNSKWIFKYFTCPKVKTDKLYSCKNIVHNFGEHTIKKVNSQWWFVTNSFSNI